MSKIVGYLDDDVSILAEQLEHYFDDDYDEQIGGAIPDVFLEYDQSGGGWGSTLLKSIIRRYSPVASKFLSAGLGALKNTALGSATGYLGDLMSGKPWFRSARERGSEAARSLSDKFQSKLERMSGAGRQAIAGDKALHNAVKLFSFSQPSRRGGCVSKRTRKRKPTTRRRRRRTVKPVGQPRQKRRKTTKRRSKARRIPRRKVIPQRGSGEYWL